MINIAQIGIGYWGSNILRTFTGVDGAVLCYACDLQSARFAKLTRQYPGVELVDDYKPLVQSPKVDAAVIATPAETHYGIAKEFLSAGKHVFIEKPFVLEVAHAEELVEIAAQKKLVLMVGHLLLYHPAYIEMKRRIELPEFGDLSYLVSARASLGIIRSHENVMWSFAPHDISLVLWMMNESPNSIQASGQSFMQKSIEDVCFLTLKFPSGRMAQIHVSWMFPRKVRLLTAVGTRQMIEVDDTSLTDKMAIYNVNPEGQGGDMPATGYSDRYQYESITFKRGDTILPRIGGGEPLKAECQHFVDCIRDGREPVTNGRASLEVVRILAEAEKQLAKERQNG